MEYGEFLKLVQERRSIRAFTADPVSDDAVERIIEAARWAPSGTNSQPWEFVVVRDQEMKDRIAGFVKAVLYLAHEVELTERRTCSGRRLRARSPTPAGRTRLY